MTAECEKTELPVEMCSHCRGLDVPEPKPVAEFTVTARFDGHCADCRKPIYVGDQVHAVDGLWLCSGCVSS